MAKKVKKPANPALIAAVKAVAVLVCICVVCVTLLAVCNELMYISDEERFNRSLSKIYDGFVVDNSFSTTPVSEYASNAAYKGQVKHVYKGTTGDYIIEALGGGGYQDGSVTLYVVIKANATIGGWTVKENVGQSYIDKIPSNAGSTWYVGKEVSGDLELDMTGATVKLTSTAINNAINMAAYYARSALGLGENPEADAQKAVKALLGDGYESATFANVNLTTATVDGTNSVVSALSDDDNTLSYLFRVTNGNDVFFAYVYGVKDTLKIAVVQDGTFTLSEGVTEETQFVQNIKANPIYTFTYGGYEAYAIVTNVDGGVYTVAGLQVGTMPSTYVLKVTIEADADAHGKGKVNAIELVEDGWEPPVEQTDANKLVTGLVGARLDNIEEFYGNKVTGATESANLIRVAVEAALTAFDASHASAN